MPWRGQTFPGLDWGVAYSSKKGEAHSGDAYIIRTVPEPYFQGDRALYLAAFSKVRETISPDGLMPDDGVLFNLLARWLPDAEARERVLVTNPARLYGF